MYCRASKTATLTQIQHTMSPPKKLFFGKIHSYLEQCSSLLMSAGARANTDLKTK